MWENIRLAKIWMLLAMFAVGITFLHYSTDQGQYYFHAQASGTVMYPLWTEGLQIEQ